MGGRLAVFKRCQDAGIRLTRGKFETRQRLTPTFGGLLKPGGGRWRSVDGLVPVL